MKKIHLIEDEENIIKALSTALELEDEEYEIHSAGDGQSGLEKARKIKPDLILLDIMLSGLDGIRVCRLLKSDEEYKSIPVIMLTALDKSENIIKGFSTGADDYVAKPFNTPELLAGITEGSRRIKGIVDELKDFARQDVSRRETLININAVVKKAVSLSQSQLEKYTQNFSVDLYQNLPAVKGNTLEIEQVIINLITNACHALANKKNEISVRTFCNKDSSNVIIEVVDEGKGIPPENLQKITDPFFTTKREQGGTGLGLSVSYNIVHDHGGTLSFASELGKGTIATISLPCQNADRKIGKTYG